MREPFDDDPSQLRPEWGSGRRAAIATIVDCIAREKGATASAGVLAFAGLSGGIHKPSRSPRRVNTYIDLIMEEKITHPPSLGAQTRGGKNLSGPSGL